ncbi:MAG: hypothetical protein JO332_10400 [Planctomycetaceae bacterium]|nr:hypothetical protein [Planctomycetaceae bacterium]
MSCLLPYCFRIEFRKVRCRVIIRAGVPNNAQLVAGIEAAIAATYANFTFPCMGDDGCECVLGNPGPWQATLVAKQGEQYTFGNVLYTIDYSVRFDVRMIWGTCTHKAAGGGAKKQAAKKRRR